MLPSLSCLAIAALSLGFQAPGSVAVPADSPPPDVRISVYESGLYGFTDLSGRLVIDARYQLVWEFSEGLACVSVRRSGFSRYGYIDTSGAMVIEPRFTGAEAFSEGYAAVEIGDQWGFIDRRGQMVIQPQFQGDDLHKLSFREGLAAVKKDGAWGFIDTTGTFVVEPRYSRVEDFSDGLAEVEIDNRSGFIDRSGKLVIPARFDLARGFSEGLAAVNIGYRYGRNDEDPNGRDGSWGVVDRTGRLVIPAQYSWIGDFRDGLALVRTDTGTGFLDPAGRIAIAATYDDAKSFSEGLAPVKVGRKWGFIDRTGKFVLPPTFREAWEFRNGIAKVDSGFNQIDRTGKYVGRVLTGTLKIGGDTPPPGKEYVGEPLPADELEALEAQYRLTPAQIRSMQEDLIAGRGNDHDWPLDLAYAGDISSVPALIAVLKRYPVSPQGFAVCTRAHCVLALEKLTKATLGDSVAAWEAWWEQHQRNAGK